MSYRPLAAGLALPLVFALVGCSCCHHGSTCPAGPAVVNSVPVAPPAPAPCCNGAPGVAPAPVVVPGAAVVTPAPAPPPGVRFYRY
jgi:hypothetical protein